MVYDFNEEYDLENKYLYDNYVNRYINGILLDLGISNEFDRIAYLECRRNLSIVFMNIYHAIKTYGYIASDLDLVDYIVYSLYFENFEIDDRMIYIKDPNYKYRYIWNDMQRFISMEVFKLLDNVKSNIKVIPTSVYRIYIISFVKKRYYKKRGERWELRYKDDL